MAFSLLDCALGPMAIAPSLVAPLFISLLSLPKSRLLMEMYRGFSRSKRLRSTRNCPTVAASVSSKPAATLVI